MWERPGLAAEDIKPEDLPPRPLSHFIALTVYWLSNAVLWGALFHVAIQSRLQDWYPETAVGARLAIVGSVGALVAAAVQVLAGALSDRTLLRWGRRRPFVVLGTVLCVPALLLLGYARSYWPFVGAIALVQLCSNIALGPFSALLPDTVNPREHGTASGYMGLARQAGDMGGFILGALLLSTAPLGPNPTREQEVAFHDGRWVLMCALLAGFMFVTMLYTWWAIPEVPLQRRPQATLLQMIAEAYRVDMRGNADFFWLWGSRFVTNIGLYVFLAVQVYFVGYSLHYENAEGMSLWILLPAVVAGLAVSVKCGSLSDRVGRRPLLFVAQYVMAAAGIVFAATPRLWIASVAGVPAGMAYGIFTAVEWALACNLLPRGDEARYLGVWNISAVIPQIVGFSMAIVGSAIAGIIPGLGWRMLFVIASLCSLLGAWFLRHVREPRN